jgi:hypothetical protein
VRMKIRPNTPSGRTDLAGAAQHTLTMRLVPRLQSQSRAAVAKRLMAGTCRALARSWRTARVLPV